MTLDLNAARDVLAKSGWFPNRKVDISAWVDDLAKRGFHLSAATSSFLEEFGRIEVRQSGAGVNVARTRVVIDPMTLAWALGWIGEFASALGGGPLSPVGEAGSGGEGSLVVDGSDEVLMLCEDGIGKVALRYGVGYQAMINLVQGNHQGKIRIDKDDLGFDLP